MGELCLNTLKGFINLVIEVQLSRILKHFENLNL